MPAAVDVTAVDVTITHGWSIRPTIFDAFCWTCTILRATGRFNFSVPAPFSDPSIEDKQTMHGSPIFI
jgi:hypothetical protein